MRPALCSATLAVAAVLLMGAIGCSRASVEDPTQNQAQSPSPRPQTEPHSPLDEGIENVKTRLQGAVGVVLRDVNGVPTVMSVLPNSPAESSGIRVNDQILTVDGESTAGLTMPQVVEKIRGYRFVPVKLTLQQVGQDDITTKTIFRGSWTKIIPTPSPQGTPLPPARKGQPSVPAMGSAPARPSPPEEAPR